MLAVSFLFIADVPSAELRSSKEEFESTYVARYFPYSSQRLMDTRCVPGEVRIRIVHRRIRGSVGYPAEVGIAAEIVGVAGGCATVMADHDPSGFRWKQSTLSERKFQDLLTVLLDESIMGMESPKPFSFAGNDQFWIEVATEKRYRCLYGDTILYRSKERGLQAFQRAVAVTFKAAGFSEEELRYVSPEDLDRDNQELSQGKR